MVTGSAAAQVFGETPNTVTETVAAPRLDCIDAAWDWGTAFGLLLPPFVTLSIHEGPLAEGAAAL